MWKLFIWRKGGYGAIWLLWLEDETMIRSLLVRFAIVLLVFSQLLWGDKDGVVFWLLLDEDILSFREGDVLWELPDLLRSKGLE